MWAAKIDLEAAYTHLPIFPPYRKWLAFEYEGKFYVHNALPFGLNCAPREWQRLMKPLLHHMRQHGCLIWVYLDDFLLLDKNPASLKKHLTYFQHMLDCLRLQINAPKSILEPTQLITFLGFDIDFALAVITVPKDKLNSVLKDLHTLAKDSSPTLRKVVSILGRVRSLGFAVPQVRLLSDQMVSHLKKKA